MAALRVVVGEDNALVREGIVRILEHGGVDVVDPRRHGGGHRDAPEITTAAR
ncbi:hypothetical protein [Pseudonocardia xinjiangensis]|uniref:Response regulatory domain-containing protein n=1 Tax=Pseudonocardia xinjiangensis TaxID=75289 RepID=A0ABX1R7E0_9PSEU|nr:hypothetical protein [Pseudonocardia xinjiangensis]NMH75804.1 hypothetical protein [Pseudonocardia xinjiangensis]